MTRRSMFTQVGLLATAQALFQTVSVLVMTVGALAGGAVASDPSLATAPIAAMFLGTAVFMIPASLWMARVGRRAGFLAGSALGVAAGLVTAWGIGAGSLALLCLGTFLVGAYQAFAQFYRFAASEVADNAFRPRAISLVLAGGIVAALLGPMLGRAGGPLLVTAYQGSFLILSAVSAIAFVALLALRVPPLPVHAGGGRPLSVIAAHARRARAPAAREHGRGGRGGTGQLRLRAGLGQRAGVLRRRSRPRAGRCPVKPRRRSAGPSRSRPRPSPSDW